MDKNTASDEIIDILQQWLLLAKENWRLLLKVTAIGFAVGVIIAFSLPKEYECSIFTAPESTVGRFGGEGGGFSIEASLDNKNVQDAILPSLYPEVISSTPFLLSLADIPVQPTTADNPMPLREYLEKHQRQPWWSYIRVSISKIIGLMLSPFKIEKEEEEITTEIHRSKGNTTEVIRISRKEAAAAAAINQRIQIEVDKKKRTITIHTRMQDPQVASCVADSVRSRIQAYITAYRTQKERKNLEYAERLYRQAQEKYYKAQEEYARYADSHQNLARKSEQKELVNLQIQKEIAYKEYNNTALQVQMAKMRVYKQRPVFAVIQPAITPLRPASPAKLKIILICMALPFTISLCRLWLKKKWSTTPL